MKRLLGITTVLLLTASPAYADSYEGGDDESEYENSEGRERGAFSPGPFEDSPVDIRDNYICISPDCSTKGEGSE